MALNNTDQEATASGSGILKSLTSSQKSRLQNFLNRASQTHKTCRRINPAAWNRAVPAPDSCPDCIPAHPVPAPRSGPTPRKDRAELIEPALFFYPNYFRARRAPRQRGRLERTGGRAAREHCAVLLCAAARGVPGYVRGTPSPYNPLPGN